MDENMTQNNTVETTETAGKVKKACRANKGKTIAILVLSILLAASVTLNICGLVRGHGMRAAMNDRIEQFDGGQMPGGCMPGGMPGQMPGGQQGQMPNGNGPQGQMPGNDQNSQNDQNSKDKKSDDNKTQNNQQDNKSTDDQKSTM